MKISLKTAEYLNKAIEKINYEHDMIESFSEDEKIKNIKRMIK